jgi:BNR repeat-like domain
MKIVDQGCVFDARKAPPDQRSCSFTNVASLADGHILICFRAGSSKDAADESLIIRESDDGGRTWNTIGGTFDSVVEGTPGGWRHGAITELRPGELVGCFCWFDRSDPNRPLANPQTQGTLPSRIFIMDSVDSGRMWINRRELNVSPFEGVATTGAVLRLGDGTLGLPSEAWKSYHNIRPGKHHALLWLSDDAGHSFAQSVITAHDPSGQFLYWDQRISVDPDTSRLIALYWTHDRVAGRDANVHVGWGSPCGKNWTKPADTGFAGQISCPLALGNGRVVAAYVHRHFPPTLRAILSEDFGETWDVAHELVFYESAAGRESGIGSRRDFGEYWADMNLWNFGHPEATRLADGDILIAFYAGDARAMSIRWVRIQV